MPRPVKRLSKDAEQRITDALGEVAEMVTAGASPNDAIVKAATARGLPAGHVNLMVNTYNIGRSEAQRLGGAGLFEKAAEFDLADAAVVLDRMFPDEVKTAAQAHGETAVSAEYSRRPDWAGRTPAVKAAAPAGVLRPMETRAGAVVESSPQLPADPAFAMKRAYDRACTLRRGVEEARAAAAHSHDLLAGGIAKLADYFRAPGCQPYPVVRENVARLLGKKAEVLMDLVAERVKFAARQQLGRGRLADPVRFDREPYSVVAGCVKQAEDYLERKAAHEGLEKAAEAETEGLLRPFSGGPAPDRPGAGSRGGVMGSCKAAGLVPATLLGYSIGKTFGVANPEQPPPGPTFDEMKGKALTTLADPTQQAKIRNAQTGAMLSDLMANDEVIAGFHPDEVLSHYNEVSQVAPRAAGNEALVRAILRKRLEGGKNAIDPYDVDLLLNIENKIKQRDDPNYGAKAAEAKGVLNAGRSVLD